ncbi:MAG: hypothetical protein HS126_36930 [Anaerolineales bacterium]|nr:hypothetical protein [Anaerolineales bacterium]
MGFLNALKGGGNKDAMRQTTSLTMAYLLEQNARFETFMRQKVDELEAIVAQQQARHAEVDPASEEVEEPWPEPEEEEVAPAAAEFVQTDTRPVKPVTSYFNDFTLDDLAPASGGAGEVFVSAVEPAGGGAISLVDTQPVDRITPPPEPEPAFPPDWQTLLLGAPSSTNEPTPEEEVVVEEPAGVVAVESVAEEMEEAKEVQTEVDTAKNEAGLADEPIPEVGEEVEETSSLLPAWLRRQQQAVMDQTRKEQGPVVEKETATIAADDQSVIETTGEMIPVAGEETAVLAGTNAGTGDKTGEPAIQEAAQIATKVDRQTRAAGAVIAEAEDEGEWDAALDKQGPAGDWE